MKISGFTIVKNAIKYQYPVCASIESILPICDEFVVNVGESEDDTLGLIQSIQSDKIRIVSRVWDHSMGPEMLSHQTNLALDECRGDWAFYLQSDEVIHEQDLPRLKALMAEQLNEPGVDALRFKWLHFYGSYYRYRVDHGWYQKQDRIIRNNKTIQSIGDAWGFGRKDGQPLRTLATKCLLYHYGWVQPEAVMKRRRLNADDIGFISLSEQNKRAAFDFGDLDRFPVYFGSHPAVMSSVIPAHRLSAQDRRGIYQRWWWYPPLWFGWRYKTWRRGALKK